MPLTHLPCTVKRALSFCAEVHRRRPYCPGAMWAIAAWREAVLVGVAIVGRPCRLLDDGRTLVVTRLAVLPGDAAASGHKGVCSMLYGAAARAAKAMGAQALYTYTDLDESGVSLRAAGWLEDGLTSGGEWTRPSRPRAKAVSSDPKRRWRTQWSLCRRE